MKALNLKSKLDKDPEKTEQILMESNYQTIKSILFS